MEIQDNWEEKIVDLIEELIELIVTDEPTHESVGNTLEITKVKKELVKLLKEA